MTKIVALMAYGPEFDYEMQEFSKLSGVEFINTPEKEKSKVIEIVKDADVILFTDVTIDAEVLDSLDRCRLIIRYGIGYDNIDTEKAKDKGIFVCNAPNYGVVDVAEHAVSLMLACTKRLVYMNDFVRDNIWNTAIMGQSTRFMGKKIGFVGFGKIARYVAKCTNALGTKALVYDPYVSQEILDEYNAESVSFDTLLAESDYVTLHLPLSDSTRHTMGKDEFCKMKNTAYIINTGRGGLVNEKEMIDALENGEIAGAGLDVFEDETGNIDKRILKMQNVVLTPHVAWNTKEAVFALHKEVTDNVVRFLNGDRPESIVNNM